MKRHDLPPASPAAAFAPPAIRHALLGIAALIASVAQAAAQTSIPSLPQIKGGPSPGDLFVVEHLGSPVGQRTSTVTAANLGLWIWQTYGSAQMNLPQLLYGLPTSMPATVGAPWNNGGLLSIVQP